LGLAWCAFCIECSGKFGFETLGEERVHSFETKHLRTLVATVFLGLLGSVVALLPIGIFTLFSQGQALHWSLYEGAAILGGAAIGWFIRR
jgi:hypothetical protein